MIKHSNRRTVCDCLYKIMTSYIHDYKDFPIKIEIINRLIDTFEPDNYEKTTNTSDFFTEILLNRRIYYFLLNSEDTIMKLTNLIKRIFDKTCFNHMILVLISFNDHLIKELGINNVNNTSREEENPSNTQEYMQNTCLYYMSHLYNDETNLIKTTSMEMYNIKNSPIFKTLIFFFIEVCNEFVRKDKEDLKEINSTYGTSVKILGTKKLLQLEYITQTLEIILFLNEHEFLKYEDFVNSMDDFFKSKFLEKSIVSKSIIKTDIGVVFYFRVQ